VNELNIAQIPSEVEQKPHALMKWLKWVLKVEVKSVGAAWVCDTGE